MPLLLPRPSPTRPVLRVSAVLAVVLSVGLPGQGAGQDPDPVRLEIDTAAWVIGVRLGSLLEEPTLRSALRSGLPLRVHARVELWKERFFDDREGVAEWRATVLLDPLEDRFLVRREVTGAPPEVLSDLPSVAARLNRLFTTRDLRPGGRGEYYVLGLVEVETLSESDLEELERWLRGDLGAAMRGGGDVEGAVTRGIRRLLIGILDLPARRVPLRSRAFDVP